MYLWHINLLQIDVIRYQLTTIYGDIVISFECALAQPET